MTIEELKRALAEWRKQGRRGPYPRETRDAILRYAKQRAAQQASTTMIAAELGIKQETLSLWLHKQEPVASSGALVPVRVVQNAIVRTPRHRELVIELGALRVRGLDVDTLAVLLRRLG